MSTIKNEHKLYYPFDNADQASYRLRTTAKGNVKQLAEVCTAWISESDEDRAHWAGQANIKPVGYVEVRQDKKTNKLERYLTEEEKKVAVITSQKKPIFEVNDIYNDYYIHAALAQVLFEGFPQLIEVVDEGAPEIKILDQVLFDCLIEDVVNEAFLAFAGKRNPTSHLLDQFLNHFKTGQNPLGNALVD